MFAFSNKINVSSTIFFQNLQQKIDEKLLKTIFFRSTVLSDLNYAENENLTQLKPERETIYQQTLCFVVVKRSYVPN